MAKSASNQPNNPPTIKTYTVNTETLTSDSKSESKSKRQDIIVFSKINYIYLGSSIGIIILGYVLLGSEQFIDATDGFSIALNVAPFVLIAGYIGVIFSIFAKSKQ